MQSEHAEGSAALGHSDSPTPGTCGCMEECREADPAQGHRAWMIEIVAFSLILILLGVLIAIPGNQEALFVLGLGVILLGKNLARHVRGMRVRPLGLILGGGALAAGLAGRVSPELPMFAIFLVAAGLAGLGVLAVPSPRRH